MPIIIGAVCHQMGIGEIRGRVDTMYSYMKKTPGEICKILGITEDEVKKIIEEMSENHGVKS